MAEKVDTPDGRVARVAGRQHGVVSIGQLREAGLSDDAVLGRVRAARLHRVHRGVYAVGHRALTFQGRCMAAALTCGKGAVVSRRSAAALWGLLEPHEGAVHVSVPGRPGRAARTDVLVHRCPSLTTEQTTRAAGIPVTTSVRTIADLRSEVRAATWRRAVRQAEVLGLRTGLERGTVQTRSELEDRFLRLCRRHRLPSPQVNGRVGRHEVDFLWPNRRLIVETDGYRYHRGPTAFEDDHARDLALRTAGYAVVRLTHHQITTDPAAVANLIRRELSSRPSPQPAAPTRPSETQPTLNSTS
jgi:very-short-patch-repair endonuclease